jgi:acyl carrier protein
VTHDEAVDVVKRVLTEIVPDADFTAIGSDARFRDALELDSLDFLNFVERLTALTGCRIDEYDYTRLVTLEGSAAFLVEREGG